MKIVGCDLHARQQSIAMLDRETGELTEKVIPHSCPGDPAAPEPARKIRRFGHSQVDRAREHCIRFWSVSSLRRNVSGCDLAVTPVR